MLRLQLRHPLPPQRLQLLLRHGAAGRGRAAATTLGRICRSPARERGPPHCAGARGAQASPIQPGAAPPAAARPTGEARFRDGSFSFEAGPPSMPSVLPPTQCKGAPIFVPRSQARPIEDNRRGRWISLLAYQTGPGLQLLPFPWPCSLLQLQFSFFQEIGSGVRIARDLSCWIPHAMVTPPAT